ncbi:unnamed protein product [Rotaria sordida]|uniref:Uncharacterized protein n=1 Tax=Rotaria sordida TaxID=392033 RepID=A0A819Q0G2_9BILA|nr:unnamed protein product [Rotaria sordida]
MSNRSLLSLNNNQELNGNVRRLSKKFENLLELRTESYEQLSSPKSQLFTSIHKSFIIDEKFDNQNKQNKNHILNRCSDTISLYNTNLHRDRSNHLLNKNSISMINNLLNLISNKMLIRIFKQILVGSSIGTFNGSLIGQKNLTIKLLGLLTTTIFIGEHILHFTQWTLFNIGKLEYSKPKIPYSNSCGIIKNIDSFLIDNMPTIVSFLFCFYTSIIN